MFQNLPYLKFALIGTAGLLLCTQVNAQWNQLINTEDGGAAQSFTIDNQVYVSGGYVGFTDGYVTKTRAYDPATSFWSDVQSPAQSNRSGGVGFSINGKGYIGLGQKNFLSFSPAPEDLLDLNEYDATTNKWTSKTAFPGIGRVGASVFVLENIAYIVGGDLADDAGATNEVWAYDPEADTWTQKADLPIKVVDASGFSVGGIGYVCGGISGTATVLSATFSYDAATDTWTKKSDLPAATVGGTAFVLKDRAYYGLGSDKALGGSGAAFPTKFYKYNEATDKWTTTSFKWPAQGRLWPVSGVVDNKAFMGTGYKFSGGEFPYGDFYELDLTPTHIETTLGATMMAYPNPARHQIKVEGPLTSGVLNLIDIQGRSIMEMNFKPNETIDVSSLPTGIYQLKVTSTEGNFLSTLSITR